jgi:hypothetical protein
VRKSMAQIETVVVSNASARPAQESIGPGRVGNACT